MGMLDRLFGLDKIIESQVEAQTTKLGKTITEHLDSQMTKAASAVAPSQPKVMRYQVDPLNQNSLYNRKKPDSSVPFEVLRKFSIQHEISRAAINYRKRQLSRLDWDIVTASEDQTTLNPTDVATVKLFFKNIGGAGNKYRKFINRLVEDLLVLDAIALYNQRTNGGQLYTILPIDAATIRLRVDQSGNTPLPPEAAYKQVIRGQVVAEFTTDEMIYDMMNPRTNSPYGLAPLESLMIIVSSSLKAGLWNLSYLTDGNIPEGFFGVPKEWTPQMIKDFQANWDAVMAGDEAATAKLKFTPEGSYTPAKKQSDMAWEQFNDWLMKVTCALFDVQPSEIGFHPNKGGLGGAGMAQQASTTSDEKGLEPLAQFVEEIFTEVIQVELGYENLAFHFSGLDKDKDAKTEAEVNEIKLRSGQVTLNELRTDDGNKKYDSPQADVPMIVNGTPTFLKTQDEIDEGKALAEQIASGGGNDPNNPDTPSSEDTTPPATDNTGETAKMVALVSEFRKFKKMAVTRAKAEKNFRPFHSDIIPEDVVDELNVQLTKAKDVDEIRTIFSDFMQDYQINFMADALEFQGNLKKILE